MLAAEVGAQRVCGHVSVHVARHVAAHLERAGVGERAVSRREAVVVALARCRQPDRPRLARREDELQPAGNRLAAIDLAAGGQVRHEAVAVIVQAAEVHADLLGDRPAGVQAILLRAVVAVAQADGTSPLRARLTSADVNDAAGAALAPKSVPCGPRKNSM